jgi:hypothetical protein
MFLEGRRSQVWRLARLKALGKLNVRDAVGNPGSSSQFLALNLLFPVRQRQTIYEFLIHGHDTVGESRRNTVLPLRTWSMYPAAPAVRANTLGG